MVAIEVVTRVKGNFVCVHNEVQISKLRKVERVKTSLRLGVRRDFFLTQHITIDLSEIK